MTVGIDRNALPPEPELCPDCDVPMEYMFCEHCETDWTDEPDYEQIMQDKQDLGEYR